VADQANLKRIC